jgi:hypothetical protein
MTRRFLFARPQCDDTDFHPLHHRRDIRLPDKWQTGHNANQGPETAHAE